MYGVDVIYGVVEIYGVEVIYGVVDMYGVDVMYSVVDEYASTKPFCIDINMKAAANVKLMSFIFIFLNLF